MSASWNCRFYNPFANCSILFYFLSFIFINLSKCNDNNCSLEAKIERKIDSIGFHRNLYYNFTLKTNCSFENCRLCLQETIPPGLFVNKDQLNDLLRLEKLSADVDENVDIEAPANISPFLFVRILKDLNSSSNIYLGNASLPVHIRYHDPQSGGGVRKFTIGQPELYFHCSGIPLHLNSGVYLTPCAGNEKDPLPYHKIMYSMAKEDAELIVDVPVGDSDIFGLVYAGTYGVVIAGSLYIAGVIYKI